LNAFPGTNLTVLLLLHLIFSPVFGLRPVRAFRVAILKVPKPNAFGLLKTCFDSLDYGVDGAFRLSVAGLFPERFLDGYNKFCFTPLEPLSKGVRIKSNLLGGLHSL
jgi:hypothetical protein